jgi:hypothetical protein
MRFIPQAFLFVAVASAALSTGAPAQNRTENRTAFEVVSVKPSSPIAGRAGRGGPLPGNCGGAPPQVDARRFAATNISIHFDRALTTIGLLDKHPQWQH